MMLRSYSNTSKNFLRDYVTIVMEIFLVIMVTPRYNFLEKGKTLLFHSVPRN